ncbi:hypothetical protein N7462_001425 [Penicillium macrosclerotiorum]|uniref:uncharacterized protein n=1 Tax=Penicillium macrosclerotiorum TaxID=303699 RepID=UPI0025468F20|nr:uncharacterized protein N7462_001425 [Penicillium macrosclerotiorum]KAJ5692002.1 hypothetical protein N7462_001425 [Penicillium macrosclerotiorum]
MKLCASADPIASGNFVRAACEFGIEDGFWNHYLPNGQFALAFDSTERILGGSICTVRDLVPKSKLLRAALGAIAIRATANKDDSLHWMKDEGTRLHMTAIQQLGKALTFREKPSLELLSAARVFSFHEAIYGSDWGNRITQYKSWRIHNSGDLALIVSKPPSFYATGPAHRLFVDGRLVQAICAVLSRKKSVLSEPEWMTAPWRYHKKTSKDYILDVLLEIPSLYQKIDALNSKDSEADVTLQQLKQTSSEIMQKLQRWDSKFSIPVSRRADWQHPDSVTTDEIVNAHIMTQFWAISMIAHDAYLQVPTNSPDDLDVDLDYCCANIVHCIPLFMHSSTGIFRQHLMPFPAARAIFHLSSTPSERLNIERAYIASICDSPVFATTRHLLSSINPSIFDDLKKAHEDVGIPRNGMS